MLSLREKAQRLSAKQMRLGKAKTEIRITRYRTGSDVTIRTDVPALSPYPSAPPLEDDEPFADDCTTVPSARFFKKDNASNRRSITAPDPFDADADALACDIAIEFSEEGFYRNGHDARYSHPYVTPELLFGLHGEIYPLDCDYEEAARNDFEVFKQLGAFSARGRPMTRAEHKSLLDSIRNVPDDLVPLYDTLGRDFTPALTKHRIGIGKPKRMRGWFFDPWRNQNFRCEYDHYDEFKTVFEAPWAQDLGIEDSPNTEYDDYPRCRYTPDVPRKPSPSTWWAVRDSDPRPIPCKGIALAN